MTVIVNKARTYKIAFDIDNATIWRKLTEISGYSLNFTVINLKVV